MTDMTCKLTLLLVAALLQPVASAQDELIDEEVPVIKRYAVEIVVFSYVEDVAIGSEIFLPDQAEVPDLAIEESDETIEEIEVTRRFRSGTYLVSLNPVLMPEEEYTLHNVIEQFELLDAYETILHVGWTQPGFPQEETEPMVLAVFGESPEGLDGSFTLYLGRYLHLVVDLTLTAPVEVVEIPLPIVRSFDYGDARRRFEAEMEPVEGPVRYRIQENRIIKNGEIRYFDHPKFGVVARVVRVEVVEESDEDEENELPQLLSGTRH